MEVITLDDAAPNPRYRDWFGRYIWLAAKPFMARRLAEMNPGIDLWALCGRIQTLPGGGGGGADRGLWLSADNSRYLAEHSPGAAAGAARVDHDPWVGDPEPVLQAVEAFLATIQPTAAPAALVRRTASG